MTKNKTPIESNEVIDILCKFLEEQPDKENMQKSKSYKELVNYVNKHYCERYSFGPGKRNHLISINCL